MRNNTASQTGLSQCRYESSNAYLQSNKTIASTTPFPKSSRFSAADIEDEVRTSFRSLSVPLSETDVLLQGLKNEQYLGPPELEHLSRTIAKECNTMGCDDNWQEHHREAVEALAVIAASRGFWEGLHLLLILYLREGQLSRLLTVYERYMDRVSSGKTAFEDTQDDSTGHSEHPDKKIQRRENTLLAVVIAAHAVQNSFRDALGLALSNQKALLTAYSIEPVVHLFDRRKDLQKRVQNYLRVLSTAILVKRSILPSHIHKLQAAKQVDAIHKISNTLIEAYRGPRSWATIDEKAASQSGPLVVPEKHWAVILSAFVKCGREDLAETLWDQMVSVGLRPGLVMWKALLESYRDLHRLQDVLDTWNAMIADGCKPDAIAYREKINALFADRKTRAALTAFEEYKTQRSRDAQRSQDNQDAFVYNAVLHGLLKEDEEDAANALLSQMTEKGPKPDIVTFNTFLKFYDRRSNLTALLKVLEKVGEEGLQPDVYTFTTVLSAFLRAGHPNAAQSVFDIMEKMGVEQNTATYTTVITYQVRAGSSTDIRMAVDVLDQMESSKDIQPNEVTYTSFLTGLHRSEDLEPDLIMKLSQDIVGRMRRRGFRIRRGIYHVLLKACLQNPDPVGVQKAIEYYEEMVKGGISFSHDTWYIILHNLWKRRDWEVGEMMVKNMIDSGFIPSRSARDTMHRILTRSVRLAK